MIKPSFSIGLWLNTAVCLAVTTAAWLYPTLLQPITTTWLQLLWGALPWLMLGVVLTVWAEPLWAAVAPPASVGRMLLLVLGLAVALPVGEYGIVPVARRMAQQGWPRWAVILLALSAPVLSPVVLVGTAVTVGWPLAGARAAVGLALAAVAAMAFGRGAAQPASPPPIHPRGLWPTLRHMADMALELASLAAVATLLAALLQPWVGVPWQGGSWLAYAIFYPTPAATELLTNGRWLLTAPFGGLLLLLTLGAQLDLTTWVLWAFPRPVATRAGSPILAALGLLALGGFLYSLIVRGLLDGYADGRLALPLLVLALLLALLGASYLRPPAGPTPWASRAPWLILPALLGLMLPSAPHAGAGKLLFIGWDAAEVAQLYRANPATGEVQQITQLPLGVAVVDFAPAPDGSLIAYTVRNPNRSSDIWTIDPDGRQPYQLLDCLGSACGAPVWSADGTRLLYERRGVDNPHTPRLWWLDPLTGDTVPLFADRAILAYGALFAPSGRWFSFRTPNQPDISLYDLQQGTIKTVPSQTGELGAWHPLADLFYYTNVSYLGTVVVAHIFQADVATGEQGSLTSAMAAVNDGSLSWSPDGRYLAFGRQPARTATGKQLWLYPTDGRDPFKLTDTPTYNYGLLAWSADGRTLAYQQFDTSQPTSYPAIGVVDVETGILRLVAPEGIQPHWLP